MTRPVMYVRVCWVLTISSRADMTDRRDFVAFAAAACLPRPMPKSEYTVFESELSRGLHVEVT